MIELARRHGVEIAHAVPGRLRLRVPRGRDNQPLLDAIRASLTDLPGLDEIQVRPGSGSLVLIYDPDVHDDLCNLLLGLRPVASAPSSPVRPDGPATVQAVARASRPNGQHVPPSNKLDETTRAIAEEAEFLAEHSHAARVIVDLARDLDRNLKRATNNNIDLKIMVPVGLAAFTFLEIGAAAATPMWVTLAIFSLNHFVELHAHEDQEDDVVLVEAPPGGVRQSDGASG